MFGCICSNVYHYCWNRLNKWVENYSSGFPSFLQIWCTVQIWFQFADLMRSQDYELALNLLPFWWEGKRKQLKTAQKFCQIIRKPTVWISGSFMEIHIWDLIWDPTTITVPDSLCDPLPCEFQDVLCRFTANNMRFNVRSYYDYSSWQFMRPPMVNSGVMWMLHIYCKQSRGAKRKNFKVSTLRI